MDPTVEPALSAALEVVPLALVVIDRRGCVVHVNGLAARWDQDPPRLTSGLDLPADFPGWLDAAGAAEVHAAVGSRARLQRTDAVARLGARIETTIVPITEGTVVWAREAMTAADPGSAISAAANGVSSRMKHDLLQPVGAIANYAELIRMQSGDAPLRHATEIARLAAELAAAIRSLT